jgi:pimeloyl-ACP methyl ester carboxylesterase
MSESTTAGSRPAEPGAATQDPAIRPFQVSIPDEDLVELRRRIDATRWPEREHVRSQHEDALPLIVTHGWPGSIIEQLKIIGPLTDPTAHGGSEADAFHVVIPSLPGHGFSAKPTATGWDPVRIARAWVVLMNRLGYTEWPRAATGVRP